MPKIRPLSAELTKKAAEELFEKPERLDEDLDALRVWLSQCPHIKARTDDQFLMMFLRGSKHSLERAKEKLDMYYSVRTSMPELMLNRDPEEAKIKELIELGSLIPLPNTATPDGPRIILVRPGVYDPSKYTIEEVFKYNTMVVDIMMKEDDNLIVAGQMGIMDLANTTMAHFLHFSPSFVKEATTSMVIDILLAGELRMVDLAATTMVQFLQSSPSFMQKLIVWSQEGSPLRQRGFHFINTPSGFEMVYDIFKNFFNKKNRSRLHLHKKKQESLYKHIPKSMLPAEYGGDAGPIQDLVDAWAKKMLSYKQYFQEEEQYGTDEEKRPSRPKKADTLFGMEGSFRQLEMD